jgi:excinuclease UvrABC nuclease subunit
VACQASKCRDVPQEAGVYFVMRDPARTHGFSAVSCGGRFKGKDPTVPVARLRKKWVKDARVLYIGKAGGGDAEEANLQERLQPYMRFGNDKRARSGTACA